MTRHRNDLQGLRAIAVLLVVASHAGVGFLKGGYVGVDVFFVLSGFLITGLLLSRATEQGSVSFSDFYVRRIRRILPAATLTLLTTEIVAYYLLNFVRAKQIMIDSTWASVFGANIYFAHRGTDYFAQGQPPSAVQHFWSLAVEEQFYLVWPALVSLVLFGAFSSRSSRHWGRVSKRAVRRLFVVVVLIAAASLAWSVYDTTAHPQSAYFSTFTRGWELAIGAALAIAVSPKLRRAATAPHRLWAGAWFVMGWAGIAAIAVAGVAYSSGTPFPGYAALLPTIGAALVIAAGTVERQPRLAAGRLLSIAPFRYVGDRSYAMYLWHWPVLIIAALYEGKNLSVWTNLLLALGAFGLSIVSYRLVENPIHRGTWGRSREFSAALAPCAVVAVIAVGSFAIYSLNAKSVRLQVSQEAQAAAVTTPGTTPSHAVKASRQVSRATVLGKPLPGVIAAVKAAQRGASLPVGLNPPVSELLNNTYAWPANCSAHDGDTKSSICRFGDTSSKKSIVLFGDSHAEMWMPALLSVATKDKWQIIPLSKSACTPEQWSTNKNAECRTWYLWAVQQAKSLGPTVLLVSGCCGGFSGTDADAVTRNYLHLQATMQPYIKRMVIVGDNVGVSQQPVDCLLASHATMKTCTSIQPDYYFYLNQNLAVLGKIHHYGFVNTTGWFCYEQECPMVVDHMIVYIDTGHLTTAYAQSLAAPFTAAFEHAVGPLTTR